MTHKHRWRFGRSEKARLRARECMKCGLTQVRLTEGSSSYATVPVTVVPVPEWLEANPHWRKHWEPEKRQKKMSNIDKTRYIDKRDLCGDCPHAMTDRCGECLRTALFDMLYGNDASIVKDFYEEPK